MQRYTFSVILPNVFWKKLFVIKQCAHMGNTRFLNTDVTLYFFWTRITRITRIFFEHGGAERNFDFWMLNCCGWPQCGIDQWWISMLSQDVLNTRFLNTDVTMNFFEHELREWHEYFWHTDLTDHTDLCSRRCALSFLNTNIWGAHGSYSLFCFHSIFCKKALGM